MSDIAHRTALGIDVGGTTTKAGIVTDEGEILFRVERPTDATAATKGALAVADALLEHSEAGDVVAVGVGAAGFVGEGTVIFSPNLTYDDPHLAAALGSRTGLPVVVDNDANVAAWGERAFGVARGSNHVALVTIGTGIGSGFVIDGELLRGSGGAAAEIGHTVVDPSGPVCGCGLKGCLEQFASGAAIARWAREAAGSEPGTSILSFAGSVGAITAEHVAKAAREYDDTARAVLRRAGRALGVGLSNIANVFDPEVIVLAGSVTRAGEPFLGPARDELARMSSAQRRRPMRLALSSLDGDAGIIGAATLALELE